VRYVVRGEPYHVGRCHCTDCRKLSGGTYTIYGQWPRDSFEVTGELADFNGERFCAACGSHVGQIMETDVELYLGTLDEAPFELAPEAELWIKRREPWLHAVDGASQHQENRPR
jgi:hypothetical protein